MLKDKAKYLIKCAKQLGMLVFITILSVLTVHAQDAPKQLALGSPAPPLYIQSWLKGEPVNKLEKGKIYVVEFWATWCGPCIAGMPHLSEVAEKFKDVTVIGCSILERKSTTLADVQKFVDGNSGNMRYHVAAEQDRKMADEWLHAFGERGIPCAFVIDREGRVAWLGLPIHLDTVLPQVISGQWNTGEQAAKLAENKRLTKLDQNEVVLTLNPYMGRPGNPQGCLARIDSFLKIEPGLKYYPKLGHFTFVALARTDQPKAIAYAKDWFAANPDAPGWGDVAEIVSYIDNPSSQLLELAADCYQAELDHYPWSMDFKATYQAMADLYKKAGDTAKAAEFEKKSETAPAGIPKHK